MTDDIFKGIPNPDEKPAVEPERDVDEDLDDEGPEGGPDDDFDGLADDATGSFDEAVPDIDEDAASQEEEQAKQDALADDEGPAGAPDDAVAETPADDRTAAALRGDDGTASELVAALAEYGHEDAVLIGRVEGDRVTRYEIRLADGTFLSSVAGLGEDLAYALGATDVTIVAPLRGRRRAIGIDIPNLRHDSLALEVPLKEEAEPAPRYATLEQFIDEHLAVVIGRQEMRSSDEWWRQGEARERLDALWQAFEVLHLDPEPAVGRSVWLRDHLDHHLPILIRLYDEAHPKPPAQPLYPTLERFVNEHLFELYRRKIEVGTAGIKWCEDWWKHGEARVRLDALWRSFEILRLDSGVGSSVWVRDHLDHHMPILLSAEGPFANCHHGAGEKHNKYKHELLPQLASSLPPGMLDEAD